jgi:cytoskeletal protein CcmA (bactofilin family)
MGIFSTTPNPPKAHETTRRGENPSLSIIASGTTLVGDVDTAGVIKIEGRVQGTVKAAQILLAKGGMIEGNLITQEAVLGGEVTGTVQAEERVEVQATALVNGDIVTRRIAIAEGGQVNGIVSTGEPSAELQARMGGERFQAELALAAVTRDSHNS